MVDFVVGTRQTQNRVVVSQPTSEFETSVKKEVEECGWFTGETIYQATCGKILNYNDVAHRSNTGIWYCKTCRLIHVDPDGSPCIAFAP